MPPIDPAAEYLLWHLFELGPTMAAGVGMAPVSHQEIAAWMELTGVRLEPWETRMLRRLSTDYLAESVEALKADRPVPWSSTGPISEAQRVAKTMQQSLRDLAKL